MRGVNLGQREIMNESRGRSRGSGRKRPYVSWMYDHFISKYNVMLYYIMLSN